LAAIGASCPLSCVPAKFSFPITIRLAIKIFRQKRLGDGIEGETVPGPDEAMVFIGNVT